MASGVLKSATDILESLRQLDDEVHVLAKLTALSDDIKALPNAEGGLGPLAQALLAPASSGSGLLAAFAAASNYKGTDRTNKRMCNEHVR